MTIRLSNFICPHCGRTGQGYLSYDHSWEFNCYCCSCVSTIPDKEMPPNLDKRQYSEHVLKSSGGVAQGNFPRYNDNGNRL